MNENMKDLEGRARL